MDNKYICTHCVGCQAQENKNWKPKIECDSFRSDDQFPDVSKMVYEQQKIKAP